MVPAGAPPLPAAAAGAPQQPAGTAAAHAPAAASSAVLSAPSTHAAPTAAFSSSSSSSSSSAAAASVYIAPRPLAVPLKPRKKGGKAGAGGLSEGGGGGHEDSVREQDRFLPVANISRIMKHVMPVDAKATKEAKECIQEGVSELISFITSEASDKCSKEKRKTINGDDVLWALGTLGFEHYVEPLRLYLERYREIRAEGVEVEGAGAAAAAAGGGHASGHGGGKKKK